MCSHYLLINQLEIKIFSMQGGLTSKQFLNICEEYLNTNQKNFSQLIFSSKTHLRKVESATSSLPWIVKISIDKAMCLIGKNEVPINQSFDIKTEQSQYWHEQIGIEQGKILDKQLSNLHHSIEGSKKFQYDVHHSFHIIEKYYPFAILSQHQTERDRCSILILLIFILKQYPKVRRYEEIISKKNQQQTEKQQINLTKKLTRYFYNLYDTYSKRFSEKKNSELQDQQEVDFIFGQISQGIFDEDYTKSLTIIFHVYYYRYRTRLNPKYQIKKEEIHTKKKFLQIIEENQTINQSIYDNQQRKQTYRHIERNPVNRVENYRFLEQRVLPRQEENTENLNECPQWFKRLGFQQIIVNNFYEKSPQKIPIEKSFSKEAFSLQVSSHFQEFFHEQNQHQDSHEKLNKRFQIIKNEIIKKWSKQSEKDLYCLQYNTICLIQCNDKNELQFLRDQLYGSKIKSIKVKMQKATIYLKQQLKQGSYNVLKLIYIRLGQNDIKFGNSIQRTQPLNQKQLKKKKEAYIQFVFQQIIHAVRRVKNERLLTNDLQVQKILADTKISSQLDIDQHQDNVYGLEKTLIVQYFCNIFVRSLEQFEISSEDPLMLLLLIQSLRLTYSYIGKSSKMSQQTKKLSQQLNRKMDHYIQYGISRIAFQDIQQNQIVNHHMSVLGNQLFLNEEISESFMIKKFGVFWYYIQVFVKICEKLNNDKNHSHVILNPTIKSMMKRKLQQCSLFYSLNYNNGATKALKLQVYFIILMYSNSIRISLQAKKVELSLVRKMTQTFKTIARKALNDFEFIQKEMPSTMFSDSNAYLQKLRRDFLDLHKFNIPYTTDTIYDCVEVLHLFSKFNCEKNCKICQQFNIFFFPEEDCFDRFRKCIIFLKDQEVSAIYTKGYKMLMSKLLGGWLFK